VRRLAAFALLFLTVGCNLAAAPELPSEPRLDEAELIRTVSKGQAVELDEVLEGEAWTIVEFTASWCPGCRQLDPMVEKLVKARGTVRLRKIDIRDWDSPVARQYRIESIPQLWLHDGHERVSTDIGRIMAALEQ
jgi:thioredoxin 1